MTWLHSTITPPAGSSRQSQRGQGQRISSEFLKFSGIFLALSVEEQHTTTFYIVGQENDILTT
jgi:hypothetical protein